jgi:hypothetical protein
MTEVQSFEEFVESMGLTEAVEISSATQPTSSPGAFEAAEILSNTMCDLITPTEEKETQQLEKLEFFLKAAKCRDDQYAAGNFPPTLTCTPYKYDLKISGKIVCDKKDFSIELVDAETYERPEAVSAELRQGVTLESVETYGEKERIVRFALNWCSFHFRKRAFRLKLVCKEMVLFVSSPFHTYARRRDSPYEKTPGQKKTASKKRGHTNSNKLAKVAIAPAVQQPQMMQQAVCWQPIYMKPVVPQMQAPLPYYFANTCYPTHPQTIPVQQPQPDVNMKSVERTSLALQLMSSLSPVERLAVMNNLQRL